MSCALTVQPSLPLNTMMNVWLGLTLRLISYIALVMANREKRGLPSYQSAFTLTFIDPIVDKFQGSRTDKKDY